MKIAQLITQLEKIKEKHGNIETSCTHSLIIDNKNIFETTIENLEVHEHQNIGKCVRVRM